MQKSTEYHRFGGRGKVISRYALIKELGTKSGESEWCEAALQFVRMMCSGERRVHGMGDMRLRYRAKGP